MHVGLWRVGPLSKLCAALVLLSLFGYACASDGGPVKDSRSAATIIGGSGSTTTASDVAAPLDGTTALSVGSDATTSSVTASAEGSSTTAEGTEDTSSSAATTAAPDGSASSAPANEAGSATTTATTGAGDPTTLPGTAAPSAPATTPVTTGSTGRNQVVGTGTPASCTSQAVVAAVAAGGTITFDCGPDPVTIPMAETAKVVNANGPEIVIDGGGLVTLSGQGQRRILYMNTCDQAQGWTTSHCQNQDHPRLTVQNLTFVSGNATGQSPDGGGAIFVRGGRLQVLNSTFDGNRCDDVGPDVGGAAIRVLSQYEGLPVTVSGSTFRNGVCSNGGAVSSIGV